MANTLAQKWIEALRSGKYKQGRYRLRTGDKFCCLGVLCDLIDDTRWGKFGTEFTFSGQNQMPLNDVLATVDLSDDNARMLADENDKGASFQDIAKQIEVILS